MPPMRKSCLVRPCIDLLAGQRTGFPHLTVCLSLEARVKRLCLIRVKIPGQCCIMIIMMLNMH